jgi:hypothetical protein
MRQREKYQPLTGDAAEHVEEPGESLARAQVHERLAERILPALSARMQRPRFVTVMAVGARTCDEFTDGELAADGATTPWGVFEWYASEALAPRSLRSSTGPLVTGVERGDADGTQGQWPRASRHPGLKGRKAIGFGHIYRSAAIGLGILGDDLRLRDGGRRLLRAWEIDQGLDGFLSGTSSAGARLRTELSRAVERGMTAGHPVPPPAEISCLLARSLCPASTGPRERRVLYDELRRTEGRSGFDDPIAPYMRRELMEAVETRGAPVGLQDEPVFLRQVRPTASPELGSRLQAIDAYESLCRPVERAFAVIAHMAARLAPAAICATDFAALHVDSADPLAQRARSAAMALGDCGALLDWEPEVRQLAERFARVHDAASLFEAVVSRYEHLQRQGRCDRQQPWIERQRDGEIHVRGAECAPDGTFEGSAYLHNYRTPTLSRFLADLGGI